MTGTWMMSSKYPLASAAILSAQVFWRQGSQGSLEKNLPPHSRTSLASTRIDGASLGSDGKRSGLVTQF